MDQAPYTPPTQTPPSSLASTPEKSSAGPIIGTVIVIIILALGALYFWGARLNQQPEELPLIPSDGSADESWLPSTSSSDDAAAIESELNATDMAKFEQQMQADLDAAEASF